MGNCDSTPYTNPYEQGVQGARRPAPASRISADDAHLAHPFNASELKRMSGKVDTIVIGGGSGGLSTAVLLSKFGKEKVLILEQAPIVGGLGTSFEGKGYEFPVGYHYTGYMTGGDLVVEGNNKIGEQELLMEFLTQGKAEWESMGEIFDEVRWGDKTFSLPHGFKEFKKAILSYFPGEADGVDEYIRLMEEVKKGEFDFIAVKFWPKALAGFYESKLKKGFYKISDIPVRKGLSSIFKSEELVELLMYINGCCGTSPEPSLAMHLLVVHSFVTGGGFFPHGGPIALVRATTHHFLDLGNTLMTESRVDQILVEGKKAVGVRVVGPDGKVDVRANKIVSAIGFLPTFSQLLAEDVITKTSIAKNLNMVEPNCAHTQLFVGIKADGDKLDLPSHNIWLIGDKAPSNQDKFAAADFSMISFPSQKDPTWNDRHRKQCTAEIVTETPWEWWEKYDGDVSDDVYNEYREFKNEWKEALLDVLVNHFPQIKRDMIEFAEVGTPITYNQRVGRLQGENYGLAVTPARWHAKWIRFDTPVKNLYISGQDVGFIGVPGAALGGQFTAMAILGLQDIRPQLVEEVQAVRNRRSR